MRFLRPAHALIIVAAIFIFIGAASAQNGTQESKPAIACRAYPQTTESFKHRLWGGYEISLGPIRNTEATDDVCTAAIYNRQGKVVYRTSGFNVTFDQDFTGQDFDGDGHPEVVFQTDTGGGMGCCWEYNVISLYPKPHKLFDIGGARFEKDAQGTMLVWVCTAGPMGFTSMAQNPYAERVYRIREGKLVEATEEFCGQIFSYQNRDFREWNAFLRPQDIQRIRDVPETPDQQELHREIVSALLSRALQHVYCRQYDDALAGLNLWPADTRAKMKAEFADRIQDDFSEFAARLRQSQPGK
jgi:hypothetical protein